MNREPWLYAPVITPKNKVGFVYEIIDLYNDKIYIGLTRFWKIDKKKTW